MDPSSHQASGTSASLRSALSRNSKLFSSLKTNLEIRSRSRTLAAFDPEYPQHLRLVSFGKTSRDTGGSNPLRSAKQSALLAFSPGKSKILRTFAKFVRFEGTGESQVRPAAAD
jgi:hypothetical protein